MGYLIFRGYSTEDLENVYVSQMPSHKKAAMRMTEYYVKGRDGALHVNEGYSNFDLQAVLVLVNGGATARQQVNAWADGTGKLITSDDLTKAYKASVIDEIRWKRVKAHSHLGLNNYVESGLFDTATITFNCEPYMYEAQDSQIVLTSSDDLTNPGSATALPLIKVEGSGDASFTFAGSEIQISDMTSGVPVYIDCENGYVYTESGASTITGEIPEIPIWTVAHPTFAVTFGSNVSRITITPRWRWI